MKTKTQLITKEQAIKCVEDCTPNLFKLKKPLNNEEILYLLVNKIQNDLADEIIKKIKRSQSI